MKRIEVIEHVLYCVVLCSLPKTNINLSYSRTTLSLNKFSSNDTANNGYA